MNTHPPKFCGWALVLVGSRPARAVCWPARIAAVDRSGHRGVVHSVGTGHKEPPELNILGDNRSVRAPEVRLNSQ